MRTASGVISGVLVMEFVLHGIAMLAGMAAGVQPVAAHLGFRPGRAAIVLIGILDLAVAAFMIAGFWRPGLGTLAACYSAALFGVLMILRFRRRLGTLLRPPDFPLFFTLSVLLLVSELARPR
jgi:hypothetical protein